jgi:hypothetical protein
MTNYLEAQGFERAYPHDEFVSKFDGFCKQAETNKVSGKSHGDRRMDFSTGAALDVRYGQGAASRAPYINFACVNIYFDTTTDKIRLAMAWGNYGNYYDKSAITEYPELEEFADTQDVVLPGVSKGLATQVLEYPTDNVNTDALYEAFVKLCTMFDKREVDTNSDRYLNKDRPRHLGRLAA